MSGEGGKRGREEEEKRGKGEEGGGGREEREREGNTEVLVHFIQLEETMLPDSPNALLSPLPEYVARIVTLKL